MSRLSRSEREPQPRPATTRRVPRILAVASGIALVTAACGVDASEPTTTTTTTTTTETAPTKTVTRTVPGPTKPPKTFTVHPPDRQCNEPGMGTRPVTLRYPGYPQLSDDYIGEVRTGRHRCYDRIVFDLEEGPADSDQKPGVSVSYVKPPIVEDPSGNTVDVAGNAFLEIRLGSWSYGPQGGTGPRDFDTRRLDSVQDLIMTENFEGNTTVVAGLDRTRPFRVIQLAATEACKNLCVVVDIATAPDRATISQ